MLYTSLSFPQPHALTIHASMLSSKSFLLSGERGGGEGGVSSKSFLSGERGGGEGGVSSKSFLLSGERGGGEGGVG